MKMLKVVGRVDVPFTTFIPPVGGPDADVKNGLRAQQGLRLMVLATLRYEDMLVESVEVIDGTT